MKYGITGSLDFSKLNLYRASLSDNFKRFANEDLMSESILDAKQEAEQQGFINKGISKKSLNFKRNIEQTKTKNYSGIWYESGWYEKSPVRGIFFNYPHSSIIFKRNRLPYTTIDSTGVYIDNIIWSGEQKDFNNTANVIGGFIDESITVDFQNQTGEVPDFPYRNVYEIFDHKNKQVGDLGVNLFKDKSIAYKIGEEIGYNEIYFQSGLDKSKINSDTKVLIFPSTKIIKNKNFTTVDENNKRFSFTEKLNEPRFLTFFYTGNLDFTLVPLSQTQQAITGQSNFGYGPILQLTNPNYAQFANENYSINLTGIYPETFNRTFCIYNTGSVSVLGFAAIRKEYSNALRLKNVENISSPYIYTNEDIHGVKSGEFIRLFDLTSNSNANYNLEVVTTGLKDSVDSISTVYVDIYKITGYKKVGKSNEEVNLIQSESSGLLYDKKSFPVNIYLKNNQTKIITDDFYTNIRSGVYINTLQKTSPIFFTSSGFTNVQRKILNLSLYSTGSNIRSGPAAADIYQKINKLGPYSNTGIYSGIKYIYPIFSGEAYFYANSNSPWINIINPNQNFRYVTGFSGNFINNIFNPIYGALTQDLVFEINTKNLLPNYQNTGASNFLVTISGNKYLFNNLENIDHLIAENKNYRFFTTGWQHFNIVNKPVKTYNPEYNNNISQKYKLLEVSATLNNSSTYKPISGVANTNIVWSGIYGTGSFKIQERKKINYYSGDNSNEWFIFSIQPDWEVKTSYLQTSGEMASLITNNYTGVRYAALNSVRFYKELLNIQILNEKDTPFPQNPCNSGINKFWRIKDENTTGCYSDSQALDILSKQYNSAITNPVLQLETGKNYHFLRVTETQLEITGTSLYFEENTLPEGTGIYTPVYFNNFRRITNLNNPNFATGFFNGSGKFFEYINFYVPSSLVGARVFNYQASGYNGISSRFQIIDANYSQEINTDSSRYYQNLTKPIFSGNIEIYNSDIDKNKIILPVVLSGVNNIDYINF
jgi:hypothetical protein